MATGSADENITYSFNGTGAGVAFTVPADAYGLTESDLDDIAKGAAAVFNSKFPITNAQRHVETHSWDNDWSWS